jgi:hypothetical protein
MKTRRATMRRKRAISRRDPKTKEKRAGKATLLRPPVTEEFIESLRGCCKGKTSLVAAREREHRIERR